MAHKAQSFRVEKKTVKRNKEKVEIDVIVLYTNVQPTPAEQMMIDRFLDKGYEPFFEEKKAGKSVAEMREELKDAKFTSKKFEEEYKKKNGFFKACKVFAEWKKNPDEVEAKYAKEYKEKEAE